jgi:hypothetical protein
MASSSGIYAGAYRKNVFQCFPLNAAVGIFDLRAPGQDVNLRVLIPMGQNENPAGRRIQAKSITASPRISSSAGTDRRRSSRSSIANVYEGIGRNLADSFLHGSYSHCTDLKPVSREGWFSIEAERQTAPRGQTHLRFHAITFDSSPF